MGGPQIDIDSIIHNALGSDEGATPPLKAIEVSRSILSDGVILRDFKIPLPDEDIPLTVAEPAIRKFDRPIIAAHQKNECGRLEVFGVAGDPSLAYGKELARLGHRVFGIDLRWTGPRAKGRNWDFKGFQQTNPGWSPIGVDCRDFRILLDCIQNCFCEQLPVNWIGHSHGGVDGYFIVATSPPGTFDVVVCNAAYTAVPSTIEPCQINALMTYLKGNAEPSLWQRLDELIELAASKTQLVLNCYEDDDILAYAKPSKERLYALRQRLPSSASINIYPGQHHFPKQRQLETFRFFEQTAKKPLYKKQQNISNKHNNNDLLLASSTYFESQNVWQNIMEPYQFQLVQLLRKLLGDQPGKVLDVGCGNGLITNSLKKHLDIVAVDLSAQALKTVKTPRLQADVTALPFPDKSFDFVYCFDVLEHLPGESVSKAMLELQRVSKHQVLIGLPLNEDLAANSVSCANCGSPYHINGHLRSYDLEALKQIPIQAEFERSAIFLSGDTTVPPRDILTPLLGLHPTPTTEPIFSCPNCGASSIEKSKDLDDIKILRALESMRSIFWAADSANNAKWLDRSEGLILLTRRNKSASLPSPNTIQNQEAHWYIDFTELVNASEKDFVVGCQQPRYTPGQGTRISSAGIELLDPSQPQKSPTLLRFPVRPSSRDQLIVELACDTVSGGSISLYGIDGLSGRVNTLLELEPVTPDRLTQVVDLPETPWASDRFGLAIDLYLYGGAKVKRIEYLSNRPPTTRKVVEVRPGLNIAQLEMYRGLPVFWTLHSYCSGNFRLGATKPSLFHHPLQIRKLVDLAQAWITVCQTTDVASTKKLREILAQSQLLSSFVFLVRLKRYILRRARAVRSLLTINKWLKFSRKLFFDEGSSNSKASQIFPARWQQSQSFNDTGKTKTGPRVLIVSHMFPHPEQPGLGSFILEQAQALEQAGAEVTVLSGRPFWLTQHRSPFRMLGSLYSFWRNYKINAERWWNLEGIKVGYVPYPILGPFWTHSWGYRFALKYSHRSVWNNIRPDLIHAHTGYLDGSAARSLSRKYSTPFIITEHTGPFKMLMEHCIIRNATLKAMRDAALIITVSRAQESSVKEWLPNAKTQTQVIPNVVDVKRFKPSDTWRRDPEAPRLLFVGYFVPIKNIPLLLDALEIILRRRPRTTLTLVGGGETPEQSENLKSDIKNRGLTHAITIREFEDRDEIARLMSECDILVLQSRSETFGCVVAEALASGRPVVATRCGGPEDIVTAPTMGALCKNGDPEALAKTIIQVADRLPTFDATQISRTAHERFSPTIISQRLIQIYNSLKNLS